MKKYFLAFSVFAFIFLSCSKDECECYYSDYYQQYTTHEYDNEAAVNDGVIYSEEQLDAMAATCHRKGC